MALMKNRAKFLPPNILRTPVQLVPELVLALRFTRYSVAPLLLKDVTPLPTVVVIPPQLLLEASSGLLSETPLNPLVHPLSLLPMLAHLRLFTRRAGRMMTLPMLLLM